MHSYSVADAKNKLSELIDRALAGEGVVISRHGHPVVEIKPIAKTPQPITKADIDWIVAHLVEAEPREASGDAVSRMRDEDWP